MAVKPPVIDVRDLWFSFNGNPVLRDVNLKLHQGAFLAMIGPNGGGKTTLLKLMLGLLEPDRGEIRVLDDKPQNVAHRIGYVPQNVHINKDFPATALEVVLMGRLHPDRRWSRHSKADRMAAENALEKAGMLKYRHRRVGELSGGQLQRVFIARALVSDPELLFLDEPTANIDTEGQTEFYELLREVNRKVTILLVTHDLLIISSHVKSVACVNQRVHHHDEAEITHDMMNMLHCPVDLVAHGIPHRVLGKH